MNAAQLGVPMLALIAVKSNSMGISAGCTSLARTLYVLTFLVHAGVCATKSSLLFAAMLARLKLAQVCLPALQLHFPI